MVCTSGYNSLAVGRKCDRFDVPTMPSKSSELRMHPSLPIVPFKTAVGIARRFFEQLPGSNHVVLLPCLLHQIHVGRIQVSLRSDSLASFGFSRRFGPGGRG